MDAFYIHIRLRLARILGVRMCPRCPRCNEDKTPPCQNKFGSNMIPIGGSLGGCPALGSAVEHQGHGTPHLHGDVHVACVYQFGTLQDVADRIKAELLSPDTILEFHA